MKVDLPVPAVALAVAAHPDDVEFNAGATLAKWADAGCVVHHLICTDGSKGTWDVHADTVALVARRENEQRAAAHRLGARGEVRFLRQVDGELGTDLALRSEVARIIRELRPAVVLGHDPWRRWRLHPDHRAAGFLTLDAVVAARDPHFFRDHGTEHHRPDAVLLFETEEPDLVEWVDETHVEAKIEALLAHESQFETTMVIDADDDGTQRAAFAAKIRRECVDDGRRAGVPLGEPFKLVEP